jgi:hypothetical protein
VVVLVDRLTARPATVRYALSLGVEEVSPSTLRSIASRKT